LKDTESNLLVKALEDYEKALAAEFYANFVGIKVLQELAAEKAEKAAEAPVAEVVVEEAPVVKPKF